jgi:uncharacterized protein (UPF0276 family)
MALGSNDTLNRKYLSDLAGLTRHFEPASISDHLSWTGVGGRNLHDLILLHYTEEGLRRVAGRIRQVQDILERLILIENVSSYMEFSVPTLTEWEFLVAVAKEADRRACRERRIGAPAFRCRKWKVRTT